MTDITPLQQRILTILATETAAHAVFHPRVNRRFAQRAPVEGSVWWRTNRAQWLDVSARALTELIEHDLIARPDPRHRVYTITEAGRAAAAPPEGDTP
jgi:hypothetical protein